MPYKMAVATIPREVIVPPTITKAGSTWNARTGLCGAIRRFRGRVAILLVFPQNEIVRLGKDEDEGLPY